MKTQIEITELENKVLQTIVSDMHSEYGFSDQDAEWVADRSNIPIKQLRGVLGSLVKKELITIDEDWDNIIYLTDYTEGFVDIACWKEEADKPVKLIVIKDHTKPQQPEEAVQLTHPNN